MILYEFLKSGLMQNEHCTYISEKDTESVTKEMNDTWTGIKEFLNNKHLLINQIPNLASYSHIPVTALEKLSQLALHPWTKNSQPDRLILKCIFKVSTKQQIKSNLEWERAYHFRDLKQLHGTLICTYPINNILHTITDSVGDYGRWMNNLLELYDGVIFARKRWKGVAFNLD